MKHLLLNTNLWNTTLWNTTFQNTTYSKHNFMKHLFFQNIRLWNTTFKTSVYETRKKNTETIITSICKGNTMKQDMLNSQIHLTSQAPSRSLPSKKMSMSKICVSNSYLWIIMLLNKKLILKFI